MNLFGNKMNNLRIIFLAAAMIPFIVQCMNDPKSSEEIDWLADYFGLPCDYQSTVSFKPSISNVILDYSFYLGLYSWAYTPESAWLERQCFLHKEQLGNTCSSTETASSTNEGEDNEKRYVFEPFVGGRCRCLEPYEMVWKSITYSDLPEDLKKEAFQEWDDVTTRKAMNNEDVTMEDAATLVAHYIDLANKRKDEKGHNE
jgi:hypothetical protein